MNKKKEKQLKDLYEQAMAAKDLHQMDEAIALFIQAADGGYQQAMLSLGNIFHWGNGVEPDDDKAIYWLKKDADLGSEAACINLGHTYCDKEDNDENNRLAWMYYEKAADIDKRNAFFLGRMIFEERFGNYEDEQQKLLEAKKYFLMSFVNGDALSGLFLWKIEIKLGKTDKAAEYYRSGEKNMTQPSDYNNWGCTLCEWGESEKALPYIEKCLSLMGEDAKPTQLNNYAECLYDLEREDEALQMFKKCIELCKQKDERRLLNNIMEDMKRKFGDNFQVESAHGETSHR